MNGKDRMTAIWLLCLGVVFIGTLALSVRRGPTYDAGVRRVGRWWFGWLMLLALVMVGAPVCAGAVPAGIR